MTQSHKISLSSAILININIMIGAGLFLNTIELTKRAGAFGFMSYGLVGLLLFPLVFGIAYLVKLHPSGGFYTFAQKEISPFAGFISAWSYFIGKLGSATLLMHVSASLLKTLIPALSGVPTIALDIVIIALFAFLNTYNLRTGKTIQAWLTAFKITPIIFVIVASIWYLTGSFTHDVSFVIPTLSPFSSTIPLVLYAFLGFEAAVSLSSNLEDAQRNGPRAILISYLSVVGLYMLYQLLIYLSAGDALLTQTSYLTVFSTFFSQIFNGCSTYCAFLSHLFNLAIAASALGSAYGIIFSNSWNLYTLAQHGHTFFSNEIIKKNVQGVPLIPVLIEAAICILYMIISAGNIIPLQLTAAFGSIIAYSLSIVALYYARISNRCTYNKSFIILALFSCSLLIAACLRNIILGGVYYLSVFFALFIVGIIMFFYKQQSALKADQKI